MDCTPSLTKQGTYRLVVFMMIILTSLCCPQYQKEALLEFRSLLLANRSNLVTPGRLQRWTFSSDCCKWSGNDSTVICSSSNEVRGLYMPFLLLQPDLEPAELAVSSDVLLPLFRIRTLRFLSVSDNSIEGQIPVHGLANLTQLTMLDMSHNRLQGSIPSELFGLKFLTSLDLSVNAIEGEISANGFGNLTRLTELDLSYNKLQGSIPSELFGLKFLTTLKLDGNNLTWNHSAAIVPKSKLFKLSLRSCSLSGPIPIWLSNQTSLRALDLSENRLEGKFPLWLAEMGITMIILAKNRHLTGSLPSRLFQSGNLRILDLSRNNFSGTLPVTLGEATKLVVLKLSFNNFSGLVPESISNIQSLDYLDLSRNRFSGSKFPVFDPNRGPYYVDISSNRFSGEIPVTFGQNTAALVLSRNEFFGHLPKNLTTLTGLRLLDLHSNNLTGAIPAFLAQITNLTVLDLRHNSFQGSVPDNLSTLIDLQILDLSDNKLTGKIPSSLANLFGMNNPYINKNIESRATQQALNKGEAVDVAFARIGKYEMEFHSLEVNWKNFERGLPGDNLDVYTILDMSRNQLSGEIPGSLGTLKDLKQLNLSHNKLSGAIPMSLGHLDSLESLDLSHNELSGEIPQTLADLQELATIDLSNNKLRGCIPEGPQMDRFNDPEYYANNSGLCGKQIQVPCPESSRQNSKPNISWEINESRQTWFSWAGAGIGFPIGFFSTVVTVYVGGCFKITLRRHHRQSIHWR